MVQKVVGFLIYAIIFVVGWALLWVYTTFGFYIVEGAEMTPHIKPEDYKLISAPTDGLLKTLRPGDIVLYERSWPGRHRQNKWLGRVVAVPGDRVKIDGGDIVVNGKKYPMDTVTPTFRTTETLSEILVPRDTVYIMHDNRQYLSAKTSYGFSDSRGIGPIGIYSIVGKY
jgi:signal peptidase I